MHQGVQEAFAGMPTAQGLSLPPPSMKSTKILFFGIPHIYCVMKMKKGREGMGVEI